jgi:hypothetical protein
MCMCGAFIFANIKYIRILIWIIRSCNSNSQLTTVARSNPPALAPTKLQHTTREGAPFLTSQQAPNRHNRQSAQKTATMEGIDQETGESTGVGRSPRFTLWVAFLTFATITMAAAIEVVSHNWRVVGAFLVHRVILSQGRTGTRRSTVEAAEKYRARLSFSPWKAFTS